MQTISQIMDNIKLLPINEKLLIAEAILKSIRENNITQNQIHTKPKILELAGSLSEKEATEWQNAINEGRQINLTE